MRNEIRAWKTHFKKKYGELNMVHIKELLILDNNPIIETITRSWFLNQKKLVIIDDIPKKISKTKYDKWNDKINKKEKEELEKKEEILWKILKDIPKDNIVVFNCDSPDKRGKFYKQLKKVAIIKKFSIKKEEKQSYGYQKNNNKGIKIQDILNKRYGDLSMDVINLITKYKSWDIGKIINELDKLFIIKTDITKKDIEKYIMPEPEENIFIFLDDLLNIRKTRAIERMNIILENTNIYAFYNGFLANLRTQVFISEMKDLKILSNKITSDLKLWNRGFLINKYYKINNKQLRKLYIDLINLDKKMKTGKMMWTRGKDFIFEIENIIIKL